MAASRASRGRCSGRTTARMRCRWGTSPTASTSVPGWRPRCRTSTRSTLGTDWREHLADPQMWSRIDSIPDAELWETHRVLKAALVHFVRRRVSEQRRRNDYPDEFVTAAQNALDPEALTIGFARRFATYKRAEPDLQRSAAAQAPADRPEAPGAAGVLGQGPPRRSPGAGGAAPGARGRASPATSRATSSSSRTTTSTSAGTWSRGSTSG